MGSVVRDLTASEVQDAQAKAAVIATASHEVVQGNQFVFFVAFDGTNNDRDRLYLSKDSQNTNAAELERLVAQANPGSTDVGSYYVPGVGTGNSPITASTWMESSVTQQVIARAEEAYDRFSIAANAWLNQNEGGSVTTMTTAFSRGCASAAVFSQLIWERGLLDDDDGDVLIAPGKISVSAGVLFDPVMTGVNGNLAFAPNCTNIAVIQATDEFRYAFKATDFSVQSGITSTFSFFGNHGDVGGTYDNGLGALTLEAAIGFFQGTGLSISDAGMERQFDPTQGVVIHTEGYGFSPSGVPYTIWSEYDPSNGRLTSNTPKPAVVQSDGDGGTVTTFTDALGRPVTYSQITNNGTVTEQMTIRDAVTANVLAQTTVNLSNDKVVTSVSLDVDGDGIYDSTRTNTRTTEGEVDELTLFDIDGVPRQETFEVTLADGLAVLPEDLLNAILDQLPSALGTTVVSSILQIASASTIVLSLHHDGDESTRSELATLSFADGDQTTIQGNVGIDGSGSGVINRSDGTYGTYTDDGQGGTYVDFYTVTDELSSIYWTLPDGSYGERHRDSLGNYHDEWHGGDGVSFAIYDSNDDGSSSSIYSYASGRHGADSDDGNGNVHHESFEADGSFNISDAYADGSWSSSYLSPDGGNGSENFDSDGFGRHETYGADGSYDISDTAPDGSSEIHTLTIIDGDSYEYDKVTLADGSYEESWDHSDGSYGSTTFDGSTLESNSFRYLPGGTWLDEHRVDSADGSYEYDYENSEGYQAIYSFTAETGEFNQTAYFPDGTRVVSTEELDGSWESDSYDSTGFKYSSQWSEPDGSHGSVYYYNSESFESVIHNVDGTYDSVGHFVEIDGSITRDHTIHGVIDGDYTRTTDTTTWYGTDHTVEVHTADYDDITFSWNKPVGSGGAGSGHTRRDADGSYTTTRSYSDAIGPNGATVFFETSDIYDADQFDYSSVASGVLGDDSLFFSSTYFKDGSADGSFTESWESERIPVHEELFNEIVYSYGTTIYDASTHLWDSTYFQRFENGTSGTVHNSYYT